jgi:hypothetical protein
MLEALKNLSDSGISPLFSTNIPKGKRIDHGSFFVFRYCK